MTNRLFRTTLGCLLGSVSIFAGSSPALAANSAILKYSTQPGGSNLGSFLSPQPVVLLTDNRGHPLASKPVSLAAFTDNMCSRAATGTLTGGSATTNSSGVGTFTSVKYSLAQNIYIKATASGAKACSILVK